jgi:head-tail adaptor
MTRRFYDRTVDLERYGLAPDAHGDDVASYTPLKSGVPARRRLAPGSERLASQQNAASAPLVFYVPWAPIYADLNPKDRLIHEGRPLDIVSAIEVGRRSEIEIAAVGSTDR